MSTVGWRCCKFPALRAIYEAVFLTMYHQGWNLSKQGPNVQKGLGPTNQTVLGFNMIQQTMGVTNLTQWSGRHWKRLFSLSSLLVSPVSSEASLDSLSGDSESVPKSLTYQSCCGQCRNPTQYLQRSKVQIFLPRRKRNLDKILSQLLTSGSSATQNLMQSTKGLLRSSACSASSFKALGPLPAIGPYQLASIDGHLRGWGPWKPEPQRPAAESPTWPGHQGSTTNQSPHEEHAALECTISLHRLNTMPAESTLDIFRENQRGDSKPQQNISKYHKCIFEGSLEVKLPTIWAVEKQRWEESEEKRSEERRCRCAKR